MNFSRGLVLGLVVAALGGLVGCGVPVAREGSALGSGEGISGRVHGGQQPVAGATVQLYTVGTTGDGSAAAPLLTSTVTTDANGNFTLTGLYSCTSATQVYLVATGGNPGGGNNPNLAMMTALGPCSNLTSGTFIFMNELTTVAAVSALAPYMTSLSSVGSGTSDAGALAGAFTLAAELVNTGTGGTPGVGVPSTMSVPTSQINTLGDIVATCINSTGGVAGDNSLCGNLFALTTPSGMSAPTDTLGALLYLAKNPTLNTGSLYNLVPPGAPFQPTVSVVPPDMRVRLTPSLSSSYVLQVGPTSLAFPSTVVGTSTAAQIVRLTNIGSGTLTLSGLGFTGANAGDFAETATCSSTLAVDVSCSVMVTATPTATGTRTAYLSVSSSSPDSPQYVSLSVPGLSGVGPRAMLSAKNLTFNSGLTADVTLSNIGSSALTISGIATATANTQTSSNCGSSLAVSGSCTISVTSNAPLNYAANIAPAFDELTVTTNDPYGGPESVGMTLTATQQISPSNVLFAPVAVGSSASTVVDFISGPVSTAISIAGANAGDFSAPTACVTGYLGSYTCGVAIVFTPSATGTRTAQLLVGGTYYVPLVGTGVSSLPTMPMTLSSPSLSFANLAGPQPITLSNGSSSAINIASIVTTSGFTQTNGCGTTLAGGSSCVITVTSTRTLAGGTQGLLTVTDDAGTQTALLSSSVAIIMGFGNQEVGTAGVVSWPFTATAASLYGQLAGTITGSAAGDFSTGSCYPTTAGGSCTITNAFKPTATGTRTALLNVAYPANTFPAYNVKYLLQGVGNGPGSFLSIYSKGFIGASQELQVIAQPSGSSGVGLSATLVGGDAADFALNTLAIGPNFSGDWFFIAAPFGPRKFYSANISLLDSGSGKTFLYPISALTPTQAPLATPAMAFFPITVPDTISDPISFVVQSPHNDAVTATVSGDSNFILTKSSCASDEVPCSLTVIYQPTQGGIDGGNLNVADTATGVIGGATLWGYGEYVGVPQPLVVNSNPAFGVFNFMFTASGAYVGNEAVGSSTTLTSNLMNLGSVGFNITGINLSGTNAPEFSISNTCGASLAPSAICTISVTFHPVLPGSKSAAVVISGDSSAGLPQSRTIIATAQ